MAEGSRRGFVCAGCWTLDRVKRVDHWPVEETLATILSVDRHGGGSAHNVAIDLRRLDPELPVEGVGLVGNDADGDFLVERAREHGVDTRGLLRTSDAATSFTDVVTVARGGRRTFFHHAGTNDLLTPEHLDVRASRARCLHLGLLGLHATLDAPWGEEPNGWVAALRAGRAAGLETSIELVSIEPERNRALALPCLPLVDRLIVNDHEIGSLADVETIVDGATSAERCLEAARRVLALGSAGGAEASRACGGVAGDGPSLVVVHFPRGAVAVTREGTTHVREASPVPPERVVGTVGAGDAFATGVLYALHEGASVDVALRLGHAVAATSLEAADAVGAVRPLADCLALAGLSSLADGPG